MNIIELTGIEGILAPITVGSAHDSLRFIVNRMEHAHDAYVASEVASALRCMGLSTMGVAVRTDRPISRSAGLPIAMAVLASEGRVDAASVEGVAFFAEVSPYGVLIASPSAINAAKAAKDAGCHTIILAPGHCSASAIDGIKVVRAGCLASVLAMLSGDAPIKADEPLICEPVAAGMDMRYVAGNAKARRGIEIAAAGGHSIAIIGEPGTGATMLARAIPSILPPVSRETAIEGMRVRAAAGLCAPFSKTPFRAPHHTCSQAAMGGGGYPIRPGEVSLAHGGVLFLDEAPEFGGAVIQSALIAHDRKTVTVHRNGVSTSFPAEFMLVTSASKGNAHHAMTIRVETDGSTERELTAQESSAVVAARVAKARKRLAARGPSLPADLPLGCSDKTISVAVTIAALAGRNKVAAKHLAEAIELTTKGDN